MTERAPAAGDAAPHLAALDGLRGIAVSLVLWYHVWLITWLPADVPYGLGTLNFNVFPETGSAGVDLFYFVSGFCLFFPYARTLFDGTPRQSLRTFTYRRALKIVPSYYLAIVGLVALGFTHFATPSDAARQILVHAVFAQNLFDDTWGGIDGVMWSLATEVQFYVVFPLLAWLVERRPLLTFGALFALGNAYRYAILPHPNVVHEIDRLPGAIDVFAAGMFAAWAYRAITVRRPRLAAASWLWLAVAIGGLVASYLVLASEYVHRYDPGWLYGWKATLRPALDLTLVPLTLGSLFTFSTWQRVLGNRVFGFLSLISYNLYLWHQPIANASPTAACYRAGRAIRNSITRGAWNLRCSRSPSRSRSHGRSRRSSSSRSCGANHFVTSPFLGDSFGLGLGNRREAFFDKGVYYGKPSGHRTQFFERSRNARNRRDRRDRSDRSFRLATVEYERFENDDHQQPRRNVGTGIGWRRGRHLRNVFGRFFIGNLGNVRRFVFHEPIVRRVSAARTA